MIRYMTFVVEIGGLLFRMARLLVLQGLFALLGGLILVIFVVLGSFVALVDTEFRKDLFECVHYLLEKWGGRG